MTDTIQFCEERAASYGAMRKSALTAIALDHAIDRMKSDTTTIEALQAQVAAKDAEIGRLKAAISGIDDDYMTSDDHHANYVLIPLAKFEELTAALGQGEG